MHKMGARFYSRKTYYLGPTARICSCQPVHGAITTAQIDVYECRAEQLGNALKTGWVHPLSRFMENAKQKLTLEVRAIKGLQNNQSNFIAE